MSITDNIAAVRRQIKDAAIAAGRDPKEILLCAATKMNDAEAVREAIRAGVDICGENRVQELLQKDAENAYAGAPLHFIGRLQTNKVKYLVGRVDLIQSVDRLKLMEAIDHEASRQGTVQQVLLEINIGREESKAGFLPEELPEILEKAGKMEHIFIKGFMAIPPISRNTGDNRKFFQEIYNLSVDIKGKRYDNVSVDVLSMGMSDDYADAIAYGSTMVRVGTAIFGQRDYGRTHQD